MINPPLHSEQDILLDIRNLKIAAGDGHKSGNLIVNDISMKLRRGEILGVIGESGAGKSTLGLAAMGFSRPGTKVLSGEVLFCGQDLTQMTDAAKRQIWGPRIAYVAQSASSAFNPMHSVMSQCLEVPIQHGLMSKPVARRTLVQLFGHLRLPEPAAIGQKYPHQLSGGQLQRALTAMATCAHPELIIFDEPTTALDVTTQVEVLAAIKRLVREVRVSAIYVTHDLAVVAQMADRIVVLRHGELIEEAAASEMLARPKHEYTRSLWAVRTLSKAEDLDAPSLLDLTSVNAGYGRHTILHDIDIKVPLGRTVALVGESGSGKSTLARVVAGLLPATSGVLMFSGRSLPRTLRKRDRALLNRIQIIHQGSDAALNPRRRIRDVLSRALRQGSKRQGTRRYPSVEQLVALVELDVAVLERLPQELSGGQRQRICIARALAVQPDLIMCDEVTSSLDQIVASEILKLLLKVQREYGCSYLFITHDLSIVRAIADWVVVLEKGRIVEQGTRSAVLERPTQEYTKRLLSSVPEIEIGWLDKFLQAREKEFKRFDLIT